MFDSYLCSMLVHYIDQNQLCRLYVSCALYCLEYLCISPMIIKIFQKQVLAFFGDRLLLSKTINSFFQAIYFCEHKMELFLHSRCNDFIVSKYDFQFISVNINVFELVTFQPLCCITIQILKLKQKDWVSQAEGKSNCR